MTTQTRSNPFTTWRFALVLGLALLASSGAFWLSMQRHLPRDANFGAELSPGLAGHLPDIDRVRLTGRDGAAVTLVREHGHFVVAERAGFAADGTRVRALLAALADLRIAERRAVPRTGWAELGLDRGTRIDLSGRLPPLSFVVGERTGPENVYVRVGERVFEAGPAPALALALDPTYWIRQRLVDVPPSQVQRIEYGTPPHALVLERADPDAAFAWAESNAGKPVPEALARAEPSLLHALDVLDVQRTTAAPAPLRSAVQTYAGLRVECAGRIDGAHHWLRLTLSAVAAPRTPQADSAPARDTVAQLATWTEGYEFDIPAERFDALFAGSATES